MDKNNGKPSEQDLQAIVESWNPDKFVPEPPLSTIECNCLKALLTMDGPNYLFSLISNRNPPLVRSINGKCRITKEGYEAFIAEREALTKLLLLVYWTERQHAKSPISGIIANSKLPDNIAGIYFDRLDKQKLITIDGDDKFKVTATTDIGRELATYLIKQK